MSDAATLDTTAPTDFASAASALPDKGASIVAEVTGSSPSPSKSTPDVGAAPGSSIPDPEAAGHRPAASAPALSSTTDPNVAAQPTATASTIAPEALAAARQSLESDPSVGPFLALQKQFSTGDLRDVMPKLQQLANDPVGFHRMLTGELRAAGMIDGSAAKPQAFTMPEPDLQNEDGSQKAYSAKAMQDIITGVLSQIQPVLDDREQADIKLAAEKNLKKLEAQHRDRIAPFEAKYPDFTAMRPQIQKAITEDFKLPKHLRVYDGNFQAAYFELKQLAQPATEERARQTVVADLQRKSAASTLAPRARVSGSAASKPKPRSFQELGKQTSDSDKAAVVAALGF